MLYLLYIIVTDDGDFVGDGSNFKSSRAIFRRKGIIHSIFA